LMQGESLAEFMKSEIIRVRKMGEQKK
jgi:hypothetical protein